MVCDLPVKRTCVLCSCSEKVVLMMSCLSCVYTDDHAWPSSSNDLRRLDTENNIRVLLPICSHVVPLTNHGSMATPNQQGSMDTVVKLLELLGSQQLHEGALTCLTGLQRPTWSAKQVNVLLWTDPATLHS